MGESNYDRWRPDAFFEVRVRRLEPKPGLLALCAQFDGGRWRFEEFADFLFDYLPEFALEYSELVTFGPGSAREHMRRAARLMYSTDKYSSRGEFGELVLHATLREVYSTEPAISKIFLKGAVNETVHGFDAVHVVSDDDGTLELLLGEVKFYSDISSAMSAVEAELQDHLERDYMRDECMLITNRLDPKWPGTESLKAHISGRKPLDEIFESITVPVLLTYDSKVVASHSSAEDPYPTEFCAEVESISERFFEKNLPTNVKVDLILVPLFDKSEFASVLNRRLQTWQGL